MSKSRHDDLTTQISSAFDTAPSHEVPGWLPSIGHSYLLVAGLTVLLTLVWLGIFEYASFSEQKTVETTLERNENLAIALEQYTIRLLKTSEAVTQLIGQEYARGARGALLTEVVQDRARNNDLFVEILVLSADGKVLASSGPPSHTAGSLPGSDLFRGPPSRSGIMMGRPLGTPGEPGSRIPIGRVIKNSEGQTEGIVVVLVDSANFVGVFKDAKVREDTLVLLSGTDGVVRALWDGKAQAADSNTADTRTFRRLTMESLAAYGKTGRLDGTPRFVTSRRLRDYPLLAMVGTAEADALRDFTLRTKAYFLIGMGITLMVLLFGAVLVNLNRRREQTALALSRARSRLHEANANLELLVHRRTQQLESAKSDLEAFSYSVAHDIRAPLATIDGFSLQLEPAVASLGDARFVHYLARIRASSRQMSELTEGLLALARLSSTESRFSTVDVSAMAQATVEALRERDPDRAVHVAIEPGLLAYADAALVRQVLENLIGNAWKFTAGKPDARIEVGRLPRRDDTGMAVLFVRDNGAGFDAQYASNLFKPFQRLHSAKEFPGTGIGLALVRRIVSLHGGGVTAEGEPGKGACFFFSLPQPEAAGGP